MKVLLDENMPHLLRQHLTGHELFTTAYMGWGGLRNGELLARAASEGFEVLATVDAGIEYEQNLVSLPCAVIIVVAESNAIEHLQPHVPSLLEAMQTLKPKTLVKVE